MKNKKKNVFGLFLVVIATILICNGSAAAADKELKFEWEHDGADLAGFRLHYGIKPGEYTQSIDIQYEPNNNAWISKDFRIQAPIESETTYYFAMTAFDADGNESAFSNEVSALIDFKAPNIVFNLTVRLIGN